MNIFVDIFFYCYFAAMGILVLIMLWRFIVITILEVFNIHEYEASMREISRGYGIRFVNIYSGKGYTIPPKKWCVGWKKYKLWTIGIYKRKTIVTKDIVTDEPYYSNILKSIIFKKVIPIKKLKEYCFLIRY